MVDKSNDYPIPIIGSTVTHSPGTNLRAVLVDAFGRLETTGGGGGGDAVHGDPDTYLGTKVGGHATSADRADVDEGDYADASQDLAGYIRVRGKSYNDVTGADLVTLYDGYAINDAVDVYRGVKTGGHATAADRADVDEDDYVDNSLDLAGYLRVRGKAFDAASGTELVTLEDGYAVHDAVDTYEGVKVGGHASALDRADVAEDDYADASQDLAGYLRTRDKTYDALTGANLMAPTITDADRYTDPAEWVDDANIAAATNYYPSSAGVTLDALDWLTLTMELEDATATIEITHDGTNWFDITISVPDLMLGSAGAATFTAAAGVTTQFVPDLEGSSFAAVRVAVVTPNATNAVYIWSRRKRI